MPYCDVHRRKFSSFESCAECQETDRRDKEHKKHLADLQERARKTEDERQERLEEERERRHRETLESQRERDEAEERRQEEGAAVARERAEAEHERADAERDWREEQRVRADRDDHRRQLREGLPSFDDAFRQEWVAVNEEMEAVEGADRHRLEQGERIPHVIEAHRKRRREALWELGIHLLTQPVNTVVVRPPAATRAAWQGFVGAYDRVVGLLVFTDPGWRIDVSAPNVMATWHLLNRMALFSAELRSTKTVREHGLAATIPPLPERLPKGLLGCGALVAYEAVMGGFGMVFGVLHLNGAQFVRAAVMGLIAMPLVLVLGWRLYVDTLLRRRIHRSICALQESIVRLVAALRPGSKIDAYAIERDALFTSSEWTMQVAFMPLLTKLEEYLEETADSWQGTGDQKARQWLERVREVSGAIRRALNEKAALERYSDPPEVQSLRRRFAYMESEVLRVGRQITTGLRIRSAVIRLLQCPACSGPVSSETSSCPYCGSGLRSA